MSTSLNSIDEAQKGIVTQEGRKMAAKKFQVDDKKADKDGDGKVSTKERVTAEATQKNEIPEMSMGGMACNCGYSDCGCGMGMMSDPIGATSVETADDIEVMISEGEYVLPANVVRWHGLKHIMDMQDEAEMGLMTLHQSGLIQEVDENGKKTEPDSAGLEDSEVSDSSGEAKDEETYETPEGNEIEVVAGPSIEEEMMEYDDEEPEYGKKRSPFGKMSSQRVALII